MTHTIRTIRQLVRSFRVGQLRAYSAAAPSTSHVLSPSLITRARALSAEHTDLSSRLEKQFDSISAKRHGELSPVVEALKRWQTSSDSLEELQVLLQDPEADAELKQLAADEIDAATQVFSDAGRALTTALVPRHPFAHLPCLLEIRPGVGGNEAALFAADLLRMYQQLCSRRGLHVSLLKYEDAAGTSDSRGSDAPLQEAILEIQSTGAYDVLRTEAGVHRVQRVPATESKGRTHTSAVSVLVLPSFSEESNSAEGEDFSDPSSDFYIYAPDVRVDVMRARGAGGQHVNTTDSAVRLTHLPTNTVVAVQEERSQLKNRAKAWQILRARLAQSRREAREAERLKFRRGVSGHGKTGRSDKIRTYNWSQQRVTDHRSGFNMNKLDDVMEGGESLDDMMDSVRAWMTDLEVEDLIEEMDEPRPKD